MKQRGFLFLSLPKVSHSDHKKSIPHQFTHFAATDGQRTMKKELTRPLRVESGHTVAGQVSVWMALEPEGCGRHAAGSGTWWWCRPPPPGAAAP